VEASKMFRIYEYNFSSTIELVTAILLVVTIVAVIV
jgi:hypothetical protein